MAPSLPNPRRPVGSGTFKGLLSYGTAIEAQTAISAAGCTLRFNFLPSMNLAQTIPTLATAVAVTAAITDVRDRRIPNRLTYLAMVVGLVLQAAVHGWRGLLLGLVGGLLFGGVFLIFHLVRAMGAGDVKLAAALGCIIGPAGSWQVMFATAVAGGALAILVMVFTGRVLKTLRSTLAVVGFHAVHGLRTHPEVNLDNPAAVRLPYGLAFAAGTLYWAFLMPMWR
jgi:prepilin peptidase CpaA